MAENIRAKSDELAKQLWAIANEFRGNMDASEFKNYILGLIFLAGVLAAGGAVFMMANKRKEKEADAYTDPDADYDEREEMELPEEEDSSEQEADAEAGTEEENGSGDDKN